MTLQSTHAVRHNDLRQAYIRKRLFHRFYMCILAVFAPVSAKCTYENSFFLKIIRAQSLPEAFFDENARIKTAFFRFSYVRTQSIVT